MYDDPKYSDRIGDDQSEIVLTGTRMEVRVFPGYLEEKDVQRIIARLQNLAGPRTFPVLVIPDSNSRISFSAVKALASEDAMRYAKATAYVIRSFHHEVMADALFRLYSPSKPLRVFKKEADAIGWLGTFR